MEIKFYCPHWGSESLDFRDFAKRVKEAGYDGVEMGLPFEEDQKAAYIDVLKEFNLEFIGQHWQTVEPDLPTHLQVFERHMRNLASAKPIFINSQTGKDWFSFEQNLEVIKVADKVSKETGVKIIHETHRGKLSFCTTSLKPFMDALPEFRIAADFSHWCCVAETFLHDQQEIVKQACSRADHIHTRVGFLEGPQINDPRAPEWKEALDHHIEWWDTIYDYHKAKGSKYFTLTTEFGPAPYMPLLAFTRQPVTSQWEVNVYMKDLLKERYKNR